MDDFKVEYLEIPELFKSYIREEPFQNCTACGKKLLEPGVHYFVEKVFKAGEIEIEYAICVDCMQEMRSRMSEESMAKAQEVMGSKFNPQLWNRFLFETEKPDIERSIQRCMISGKPLDKESEYQIHGHFEGDKLVYSIMPYAVSFDAVEEMQEVLSAKTKEELDRFMKDNLGLPPEWREIFRKDLILI